MAISKKAAEQYKQKCFPVLHNTTSPALPSKEIPMHHLTPRSTNDLFSGDMLSVHETDRPSHGSEEVLWSHVIPDSVREEMEFLAKEIMLFLKYPEQSEERLVIDQLPSKINPPLLGTQRGTIGWGLYAEMGFSLKKFLWSLVVRKVMCVGFWATWIWYKGDAQITTAEQPATILMTTLSLRNGMSQRFPNAAKPLPERPDSSALPPAEETRNTSLVVPPNEDASASSPDASPSPLVEETWATIIPFHEDSRERRRRLGFHEDDWY